MAMPEHLGSDYFLKLGSFLGLAASDAEGGSLINTDGDWDSRFGGPPTSLALSPLSLSSSLSEGATEFS